MGNNRKPNRRKAGTEEAVGNATPSGDVTRDLPIDRIEVGKRFRKDPGDIEALAESFSTVGLLQPVVVTGPDPEGRYELVAGARRLLAAQRLGWATIPVRVANDLRTALDRLRAERDENTCRKDLTLSEAVALGKALEPLQQAEARRRQAEAGPKKGRGKKRSGSGKLPGADKGDTRDKVGEAVGLSGRTYEKAKAVVEAAAADPDRFGHLVAQMDATGKVDSSRRELERLRSAGNAGTPAGQDTLLTRWGGLAREGEALLERARRFAAGLGPAPTDAAELDHLRRCAEQLRALGRGLGAVARQLLAIAGQPGGAEDES
jgi:ParB family chromosome partitioning protein